MVINFRKIFEKIISISLDILIVMFGFILLVFVYNNIQTKILGNDYSSLFGFSTFEVQTGSMEGERKDSISIGDWIVVKYTTNIEPGDIITFHKDDNFVTHRVVEEYNGTYITMGDANNSKDEPVSREQIVGKVVKILPSFGIIRKTILNPIVLVSLIITIYLVGYALRNVKSNKEELNNKEITKRLDSFVNKFVNKFIYKNNDNKKSIKKKNKSLIKDKYEFIETEIDVSRSELDSNVADESDEIVNESVGELDLDDGEEIVLPEIDMEKTMYFRMISVNKSDIDGLDAKPVDDDSEVNVSNLSDEELENVNENEVQKCNDMINTKKKKFKNIIEKVMYIKKDELESILNIFNRKEKLKANESTIIDTLIDVYIRAKYYNFDTSKKSVIVRINDALKTAGNNLISSYKGKDKFYSDKVNKFVNYLMLTNELDKIDKLFDNIQARRENYNNKLLVAFKSELTSGLELKDMVNGIIKTKKVHDTVINESISKLMSSTFELEVQEIYDKKKLYSAKLVHNINFSKIYSDYIVDKTYSEGTIAEDKVIILITLLLTKIIKEVVCEDVKNKYLVYIPESIYKKSNKLSKILSILEDDIAKNSIVFFNDYDEIIGNKKVLKALRKDDYHFAVRFSRDSSIKEKDASYISLCEYLFVDAKIIKEISLLDVISEEDKTNIIKEDVYNKVVN